MTDENSGESVEAQMTRFADHLQRLSDAADGLDEVLDDNGWTGRKIVQTLLTSAATPGSEGYQTLVALLRANSPEGLADAALANIDAMLRTHRAAGQLNTDIAAGEAREPTHVSDATFEYDVLQSQRPVLVDFWAPWCGPCRQVAPIVAKLALQKQDEITVAKVNTDENPVVSSTYGIQSIPTFILFADGKEVARRSGGLPLDALTKWVDQSLAGRQNPGVS